VFRSARFVIEDRSAFILRETRLLPVPHASEIRLYVADEATALWQKTEDELETIGLPPPFWAFAWAGGQALARYILDHPETVKDRTVLDFACGSGLVGIAAMMAGAKSVEAVDIDAFAVEATRLNAAANDVTLEAFQADWVGQDRGWDVVLAGDIAYEKGMSENVFGWLSGLSGDRAVLIGDPGRAYLPKDKLTHLAEYRVPVLRSLEDNEVKRTSVWRLR
jgi:predicted nicotinamide N-methyase